MSEENRDKFSDHAPSEMGVKRHNDLTQCMIYAANVFDMVCPPGREKSLAMTKLEEAKMWASASVARNPETR